MELEEFQLSDGEPEEFNERTFVINDESQALWAMRKLAVSQRRIDTVQRQAKDEIDRVAAWVEQATRADKVTVLYFEEILTSYMLRLRDEGRKSLILPDGEIKSRETPSRAVVEDLDVFIKWAKESHPEFIRTKEEADLNAMKQVSMAGGGMYMTLDGEVVEGIKAVEGSVSVSFDINGKDN
jgi:phage host-nuclease inhibitor protein Gam